MKSAVALTFEMDDTKLAAKELADSIKTKISLEEKGFGILLADSELSHKELLKDLDEELSIPIIGCTTTAIIDGKKGFNEMCTSLLVITGDDIYFSIACSETITVENAYDQIKDTYQRGLKGLDGNKEKIIYALPPSNMEVMLDEFPETLSKLSGNCPVFGGLASFNDSGDAIGNFCNGNIYSDRMVLLLFGGDIRPIFSMGSFVEHHIQKRAVVTRAEKNIVYTVEDMTFLEYCQSLGLTMSKPSEGLSLPYVTTPMIIEPTSVKEDDGVPIIRAIHEINEEDGSCNAICKVPENSILSIASLKRSDIEISTQDACNFLVKQMQKNSRDGYEYSVVLCISCIGRFLVIAPDNSLEGQIVSKTMPRNLNVIGGYSYGEIGPTSITDGRAVNRALNHSIVMVAI